jgi:hypothetical protein
VIKSRIGYNKIRMILLIKLISKLWGRSKEKGWLNQRAGEVRVRYHKLIWNEHD